MNPLSLPPNTIAYKYIEYFTIPSTCITTVASVENGQLEIPTPFSCNNNQNCSLISYWLNSQEIPCPFSPNDALLACQVGSDSGTLTCTGPPSSPPSCSVTVESRAKVVPLAASTVPLSLSLRLHRPSRIPVTITRTSTGHVSLTTPSSLAPLAVVLTGIGALPPTTVSAVLSAPSLSVSPPAGSTVRLSESLLLASPPSITSPLSTAPWAQPVSVSLADLSVTLTQWPTPHPHLLLTLTLPPPLDAALSLPPLSIPFFIESDDITRTFQTEQAERFTVSADRTAPPAASSATVKSRSIALALLLVLAQA
mmetsp:Transcript_7326/g.23439  ORF Transcript_7326/g.23439 Transcript_7326/m.23439 type:complete len:310 (-) Transcript_7326:89-1018(-)